MDNIFNIIRLFFKEMGKRNIIRQKGDYILNKKITIFIVILCIFFSVVGICIYAYNKPKTEEVIQGTGGCPLSELAEAEERAKSEYEVYSPIGSPSIKLIEQAPRLTTLSGKTIAIVGGSFMANITHPEIKRLIMENYPDAKVILLSEIGSAGPYPAPGVRRQQKDEFEKKLKEMHVDAVISGNGGCGLCTPKEEGSCITAEYIGIPSVMIAAPGFAEQAKSTALTAGIPVQRVAVYPGAFASHTKDELIKNTREILWKQIVDGLTKPITEEEMKKSTSAAVENDGAPVFTGTLDEIQEYFEIQGWTDGSAIIPPTREKIDEFLKYSPYPKDTVIGNIPPEYRKVTAENVAVVGVMSGCKPEYMPILTAFTKAMMNGDFRRTLSSTHAWTPYVWINGPIARQLGIDAGQGEISSPNNKKIGRFIDLAMINLGGYDVKKNRMGTFGYLSSWVMAEDEEASARIGWQPYHVLKGYNINDNTLTAASSLNWGNNLTPATSNADRILELMAWDAVEKEQFALGAGTPFVYRAIFITEYVARDLAKKYHNKNELEYALINKARRPLDERTYANYWANPGSSFEGKHYTYEQHKSKISQQENAEITDTPDWLFWTEKKQMETVPVMTQGKTAVIVTGDANRNKVLTVPGGGMATIKIELPENWDSLMSDLGYKPLNNYFLKINNISGSNIINTVPKSADSNINQSLNDNNINQRKKPTAEQYRQIRQQRQNGNHSQQGNYQNSNKRPSPEQYRKMRKSENRGAV